MDEASKGDSASPESRLMEEVLCSPDLQYDSKGKRIRDILRFLLERYQQDPAASSSEDDIANAVYGGPELDREDSTVRKRISAARARLAEFSLSLHTSRPLRVRIPPGQYRLEFYKEFLRFGVDPVQWFWGDYLNESQPVVIGFLPFEPKGTIAPEDALSLYHRARDLTQKNTDPNFMTNDDWSSTIEAMLTPKHKLLFGIMPIAPRFVDAMWKRRPDLEPLVMFRDPTGQVLISHPHPPPKGRRHYVNADAIGHVLLTRFTVPKTKTQITTIVASAPDLIVKTMDTLNSAERLFPIVTAGPLCSPELDSAKAPSDFQLLFQVREKYFYSQRAISYASVMSGRPQLRLACVYGKEMFEGILVNKRDSAAFEPQVEHPEPSEERRATTIDPPTPPKDRSSHVIWMKNPGRPYEGDPD